MTGIRLRRGQVHICKPDLGCAVVMAESVPVWLERGWTVSDDEKSEPATEEKA